MVSFKSVVVNVFVKTGSHFLAVVNLARNGLQCPEIEAWIKIRWVIASLTDCMAHIPGLQSDQQRGYMAERCDAPGRQECSQCELLWCPSSDRGTGTSAETRRACY